MTRPAKWQTASAEELAEARKNGLCRDCRTPLAEGRVRYCEDCVNRILEADDDDA